MSGNTEEPPFDERQRRAVADTAVAMRWAGNELTGHAGQVVARVFEHLGVSEAQEREAQIDEMFADMESGGFQPSEAMEPIALSQGKVARSDFAPLNRLYSPVFLPKWIARNPPPTGFTRGNHAEAVPGRAGVWPRHMVSSPGLLSAGVSGPADPPPANGRLSGAWAYSFRYMKHAKGAGKP